MGDTKEPFVKIDEPSMSAGSIRGVTTHNRESHRVDPPKYDWRYTLSFLKSGEFGSATFLVISSLIWILTFFFLPPNVGRIVDILPILFTLGVMARTIADGNSVSYWPDMTDKVVIITGGNSGVGRICVERFLELNAEVIIACRSAKKGREAAQETISNLMGKKGPVFAKKAEKRVHVIELDVSNFDSVRKFAQEFSSQYQVLDVLINNAGIMGPPFSMVRPCAKAKFSIESQILSNYLGHYLLTNLLLPSLKKAEAGRIVNVSSMGHRFGPNQFTWYANEKEYNPVAAYGNSKLAQIHHTRILQKNLDADPNNRVTAYSLHPGSFMSPLWKDLTSPVVRFLTYPFTNLTYKTMYQGSETYANEKEYNPVAAYGNSKLAQIHHTRILQKNLDADPNNRVTAYSLHPGSFMSPLWKDLTSPVVRFLTYPFTNLTYKTMYQGSETHMFCATDPRAVPGEFHGECGVIFCSEFARDMRKAAQTVTMTDKIIAAAESGEELNVDILFH
eukprot:TRINITY_DN11501_c0_g1_i1.p1 TRINITY_DN11501_c0_g1~~TRINITY_DN11501_c0_g1_i1.p1  ORF type:complete len:522 (-),score=127.68 TRINITY_DN11501_c0_g1_i1:33-1544(-)